MTKNIRVLVANHPRLIRELVLATISDQVDIEVVGEVQHEADILASVDQQRPDFLIVALDHPQARPAVCDAVLARFPNMKILGLAPERNTSVVFWASHKIHCFDVEASEEGILEVLRGRGLETGTY